MILGTWIISYSIFGMPKHIKDIKSYLGYVPIFCFNAANSKNATIYSLFAEQNSGDELVFFESEEYVKIDIVKWNKYVAGVAQRKKDTISLSDCFKISDDKYCAYIVKEIKNELGKASLKNIVFGDYKINIDKEKLKFVGNIDYEEYFNELYKGIKGTIEESFGEDWVKRKEIRPEDAIRLKESVVPKLFGYLYNSICGIDVGLTEDFDLLEYFFGDCVDRRVKLLDYNSSVEEKTYELFDGIYNDLNKCFSDSLNARYVKSHKIKAGRNDACPCGSGKKYKKCCGR